MAAVAAARAAAAGRGPSGGGDLLPHHRGGAELGHTGTTAAAPFPARRRPLPKRAATLAPSRPRPLLAPAHRPSPHAAVCHPSEPPPSAPARHCLPIPSLVQGGGASKMVRGKCLNTTPTSCFASAAVVAAAVALSRPDERNRATVHRPPPHVAVRRPLPAPACRRHPLPGPPLLHHHPPSGPPPPPPPTARAPPPPPPQPAARSCARASHPLALASPVPAAPASTCHCPSPVPARSEVHLRCQSPNTSLPVAREREREREKAQGMGGIWLRLRNDRWAQTLFYFLFANKTVTLASRVQT